MHELGGILAGVLTLAGFVPLVLGTVVERGRKVRPSRATWLIWAIESMLIYKTFAAAAPSSSALWIPLGFTAGATVMVALAVPFGEGGWSMLDKLCLGGAAMTIALWRLAGPLAGLLAGIGTDLIGAVPTVVKAWSDPASESRAQWILWWLGAMANLCAIRYWSVAESAYPVYGIILTTTMLLVLRSSQRKGGEWMKPIRYMDPWEDEPEYPQPKPRDE